jgi:hypothetical protein
MNFNEKEKVILNDEDYEKYSNYLEKMKNAKNKAEMDYYYYKAKKIVNASKKNRTIV